MTLKNASRIPRELRDLPQWVTWKWGKKPNGEPTKVPTRAVDGLPASSTNPDDWSSFQTAYNAYHHGSSENAGIGLVFTEESGLFGVDFDDCLDKQQAGGLRGMRPTEFGYLKLLDSYAEVSPSGEGFKVIARGTIPDDVARRSFGQGNGIYSSGRFFTITGDVLPGYDEVRETEPSNLRAFLTAVFPKQERSTAEWSGTGEMLTDVEVINACSRSANGEKFRALYQGDWEAAGDYGSQPEAYMALCQMLTFDCGPNHNQIDRLFRQSGLFRDKWDEQRGDDTYGANTVENAIATASAFYTPTQGVTVGTVTTYGPVKGEVEQLVATQPEMPQDAPKPPTRIETKQAWKRMLAGYAALTAEDRPYWLGALVEHIEPLGRCFREDWLDFSVIGFFSALWVGKRFENLPLNVWTLGISGQGTGKSVVADELDEIMHAVNSRLGGAALLRYSSGSAQGLVRRLEGKDRPGLAYFSEWTGFASSMDADHSSNMRETLMNLYDGRSIFHQLAQESISVQRPHLVISGLTTPHSWARTADAIDAGNGLYSRFLIFMPDFKKTGFKHRDNEQRAELIEALAAHIDELPEFSRVVFKAGEEGPECYQVYRRDVLGLDDEAGTFMDMDDALLLSDEENLPTGRQAARVKKVAALLELLEQKPNIKNDTLGVRDRNVERAIRVVQRGAAYSVRAFGLLSRSRDDMDAAKVRRAVERFQSLSILGVLKATGLNQGEARRALDMLVEEGAISTGIDNGRRLWFRKGA